MHGGVQPLEFAVGQRGCRSECDLCQHDDGHVVHGYDAVVEKAQEEEHGLEDVSEWVYPRSPCVAGVLQSFEWYWKVSTLMLPRTAKRNMLRTERMYTIWVNIVASDVTT